MSRPVLLRNGVEIADPLRLSLDFVEAYGFSDHPSRPSSFDESDLRLANRGGARISAAEIGDILERRPAIERALRRIALDASLAGAAKSVPWLPLRQLFNAFADIRGVGFSKVTKALHRKRPALIPMLDSVVQKYLEDDDPGPESPFGERALALVRGGEELRRHQAGGRERLRGARLQVERRALDGDARRPDLRVALAAARLRGSLRVLGLEGEVREGLRGGLEQGDEPRSLRPRRLIPAGSSRASNPGCWRSHEIGAAFQDRLETPPRHLGDTSPSGTKPASRHVCADVRFRWQERKSCVRAGLFRFW